MNTSSSNPVKVMIVDDSAVIRSIIERILKTEEGVKICGYAANGEQAVKAVETCKPDIILLDIEMPVMDGITAIPLLLAQKKDLKIIMCSTLSGRGAEISVKAMSLGAADCILKPGNNNGIQSSEDFKAELLRLVREIGKASAIPVTQPKPVSAHTGNNLKVRPKVVAIGSSTGGPNALEILLKQMNAIDLPIVITQHIPPSFAKVMAAHLSKTTGLECIEAENGMKLVSGKALIAPGNYHMNFRQQGEDTVIALNDGPAENFCKPAVDPMLRSLVNIFGAEILMIMLTGMGEDGLKGTRQLVEKGAHIIAQDQASSVVWGMAGAVANAGLCNDILPLDQIGPHVSRLCGSKYISS